MPVNRSVTKNFLTFVAGLITEASPLTFPENSSKDLDNVDLRRDGSIRRRLGLEQDFVAFSDLSFAESDIQNWYISSFVWRSVDGDGSQNFLVIQVGPYLVFHNFTDEAPEQSALGYIDFSAAALRDAYLSTPTNMTQGRGRMYVANKNINPFSVSYDNSSLTFTGTPMTIQIRDKDGLDETDDTTSVTPTGQETPPDPDSVPRVEFALPYTSLI